MSRKRDVVKIEANANKYSWVWGKAIKRYKGRPHGEMLGAIPGNQ